MADETPYGKITLESIKEAVEYVFREQPKKDPNRRVVKFLRGGTTYGMINSFEHCGNEKCYSCNYYNNILQEEFKKQLKDQCKIYGFIGYWQDKLSLNHIYIETEEIERDQVTFPNDISEEDKYFVGIRLEEDTATIYHDRELTEEDIVHELLHIANPNKSEEWVVKETKIKLDENKRQNS